MATNRKRTPRSRKDIVPLDDSVKEFLLYGTAERDTPGWSLRVSRFFDQGEAIENAWRQHEKALRAEWEKTGRAGEPWGALYIRDPYSALYGRRGQENDMQKHV